MPDGDEGITADGGMTDAPVETPYPDRDGVSAARTYSLTALLWVLIAGLSRRSILMLSLFLHGVAASDVALGVTPTCPVAVQLLDAATLHWSDALDKRLYRSDLEAGSTAVLQRSINLPAFTIIERSGTLVAYFVEAAGETVRTFPLADPAQQTTLASGLSGATGIAATSDEVVTCEATRIVAIRLDTGAQRTIVSGLSQPRAVQAYHSGSAWRIVWAEEGAGRIGAAALDGSSVETLATEPGVAVVATRFANGMLALAWHSPTARTVRVVIGGQELAVAGTGQDDVKGIAFSPSQGFVVWSVCGVSSAIRFSKIEGFCNLDEAPLVGCVDVTPGDACEARCGGTLLGSSTELRCAATKTGVLAGERPTCVCAPPVWRDGYEGEMCEAVQPGSSCTQRCAA